MNTSSKTIAIIGLPIVLFLQVGMFYAATHLFNVDFGGDVTTKGFFLLLIFFGSTPATSFLVLKIVELGRVFLKERIVTRLKKERD